MIRKPHSILALLAALWIVGFLTDRGVRAEDVDLTTIRDHLASSNFQLREQGRTELSKLPPSTVDALRVLEKKETDEEAATHLHARIREMEAFILTHPASLSLKRGDYSLAELAASLNKQLGTDALAVPSDNRTFTLAADNQPFWEILRQVYDQQPFNVEAIPAETKDPHSIFRLTPLKPDAKPQSFTITDSFAVLSPAAAEPGSGGWRFHADIFCDPRVKIVQHQTAIVVDKITTFKGENLFYAVGKPSTGFLDTHKPITHFQATFMVRQDSANPTHLKEVRGSVAMKLVDAERTISFDLTKNKIVPVDTLFGIVDINKDAGGIPWLTIISKDADGNPIPGLLGGENLPELNVRFLDKNGGVICTITCHTSAISLEQLLRFAVPGANITDVASIDFPIVEKMRDCTLPLVFEDVDLLPLR